MAQIGGYWANLYGKVADIVVTVVGYESNDSYTLNLQYAGPNGEVNEYWQTSGSADTGETVYHVFPTEVVETTTEAKHGIFPWISGQTGVGVLERFPPTTLDPIDVDFDDQNPVAGLTSEVSNDEEIEVAVQAVRRESSGKVPDANVWDRRFLIEGGFAWYAGGSQLGSSTFQFEPDWSNNDWTTTAQQHPISTVEDVPLTTPNTIGDYEFCCNIEQPHYYVPDDSQWHTPINRL